MWGWLASFLGPLLVYIAAPAFRQILISLGIGIFTFVGLDALISDLILKSSVSFNSLSGDVASIFGMAGGFRAISIITGGITFRVSMIALKQFRLL
jgi:hypothetical protein